MQGIDWGDAAFKKERRICGLAIILLVAGWALFNQAYTTESVFVTRDPDIYTVAGVHLIENNDFDVKVQPELQDMPHVLANSSGFGVYDFAPGQVLPQGLRLLPVFIGLSGRVVGVNLALSINVMIAASALLAFYGFAQMLARPRWALLATSAFAVSLPLIHFSRDTFTEPLVVLFVFGGLSLLWLAQKTQSKALWLLAGITTGASLLARIDAFIVVIGLVLFLCLYLLTRKKSERKQATIQAGIFLASISAVFGLSWLDLTTIGNNYQSSTRARMVVAGLVVLAACTIAVIVYWKSTFAQKLYKKYQTVLPYICAGLFILLSLIALSRPLWHVGYHDKQIPLVASLQQALGEQPDSSRDYSEQTVSWIIWYLGPLLTLLGFAGIAIAIWRVFSKRDIKPAAGVLVVITYSLLFLNMPSITPDQIWATRRLLPVIIPGVLVFSVVAFGWIDARYKNNRKARATTTILLAAVAIIPPLMVSAPFVRASTKQGQLNQINEFCQTLPDASIVVWTGEQAPSAVQATRVFCDDVPTYRLTKTDSATLQALARRAEELQKTLVVARFDDGASELPNGSQLQQLNSSAYNTLELKLNGPPENLVLKTRTIYYGFISQTGDIVLPRTTP